jgi:hypothetical protein
MSVDEPVRNANAPEGRGVHYTDLPEAKPGEVLYLEWNTYRRIVGRLLAEGNEGRFVLIKGEEVLGLYDTWKAARTAGLERFLLEPFLVKPVLVEEPPLRVRGVNYPWPTRLSRRRSPVAAPEDL